jgi:hypothetical protein
MPSARARVCFHQIVVEPTVASSQRAQPAIWHPRFRLGGFPETRIHRQPVTNRHSIDQC